MFANILFITLVGSACVQAGVSRFPQYDATLEDDDYPSTEVSKAREARSILEYDEAIGEAKDDYGNERFGSVGAPSWNSNSDFDDLYEFPIQYAQPQQLVEEANDVAQNEHTHRPPTAATDKSPHAHPATERPTKQPSVNDFFDVFGHAINDVVNENAHNFNKEIESVFVVGKSVVNAAKTIADSKIDLANSFPRIGKKFLDDWRMM